MFSPSFFKMTLPVILDPLPMLHCSRWYYALVILLKEEPCQKVWQNHELGSFTKHLLSTTDLDNTYLISFGLYAHVRPGCSHNYVCDLKSTKCEKCRNSLFTFFAKLKWNQQNLIHFPLCALFFFFFLLSRFCQLSSSSLWSTQLDYSSKTPRSWPWPLFAWNKYHIVLNPISFIKVTNMIAF